MEGNVKMFDSNLTRLAEYSVLDDSEGMLSARPSTPTSISSGGSLKRGGVVNARVQSARRVSRTMQQASSATGGSKPRASTPKRATGRVENRPGSAATTTHSQSTSNAVLTLDMDFNAFFYAGGGRGGISGETLVVATAAGNCMRLHIDAPTETPPSQVSGSIIDFNSVNVYMVYELCMDSPILTVSLYYARSCSHSTLGLSGPSRPLGPWAPCS